MIKKSIPNLQKDLEILRNCFKQWIYMKHNNYKSETEYFKQKGISIHFCSSFCCEEYFFGGCELCPLNYYAWISSIRVACESKYSNSGKIITSYYRQWNIQRYKNKQKALEAIHKMLKAIQYAIIELKLRLKYKLFIIE